MEQSRLRQSTFRRSLILIAIGTILLAALFRIAFGARWFSFYGYAALALCAVPPVTALLSREHRHQGWRRWPVWLLALLSLLAALVQIGFWLTFFYGDGISMTLGVGREFLRAPIDRFASVAIGALAISWIGVVLRVVVAQRSQSTRTQMIG